MEETAARLYLLGKNYFAIRNYEAAKGYLIRAVGRGSSAAARLLLSLGRYFLDAGGEENFRAAKDCFRALAERGNAEGCLFLGRMAEGGLGAERDVQAAFDYFAEAYRLGMGSAAYEAGRLMLPDAAASPHVRDIAAEWFREAAEAGVAEAWREIGLLLCDGIPAHHREALGCFLRGVRAGDAEAMVYAADIYLSGIGAEQNVRLAFFLLGKAAEEGSRKACRILSLLYRDGRYTEKDEALSQAYADREARLDKEGGKPCKE